MTVLRHPPAFPPHFVASVWRYHQPHPFVRLSCQAPMGKDQSRPGCSGLSPWSPQTRFPDGALRASQVPGESSRAFAPLSDPGRARAAMPITAVRCCPRYTDDEGRSIHQIFEAPSHGFSTRCLRFQLRLSLHWQDSLPVGGKPLPDGIRTHWTPKRISCMVVTHTIPTLQV